MRREGSLFHGPQVFAEMWPWSVSFCKDCGRKSLKNSKTWGSGGTKECPGKRLRMLGFLWGTNKRLRKVAEGSDCESLAVCGLTEVWVCFYVCLWSMNKNCVCASRKKLNRWGDSWVWSKHLNGDDGSGLTPVLYSENESRFYSSPHVWLCERHWKCFLTCKCSKSAWVSQP